MGLTKNSLRHLSQALGLTKQDTKGIEKEVNKLSKKYAKNGYRKNSKEGRKTAREVALRNRDFTKHASKAEKEYWKNKKTSGGKTFSYNNK